jgi:predicted  nucleic acid-binding Zn-ribbon protein
MEEPVAAKSGLLPSSTAEPGAASLGGLGSFRIIGLSIFAFAAVYVVSLDVTEILLQRHFAAQIERALRVSPADGPIISQIQLRIQDLLTSSRWIQLGEARVSIHVYGADGITPLYLEDRFIPIPETFDPVANMTEAVRLLPASYSLEVSVPPTGTFALVMLNVYVAILITSLFFYNRAVTARDSRLLESALTARNATARRTETIAEELKEVRERLAKVEPTEHTQADEIRELQRERQTLRGKLSDLADREAELRHSAARSIELDQERQALEDLLEEASGDLDSKEEEIQDLQARLKTASKNAGEGRGGGRTRAVEHLTRRFRTLYQTVEFDDRVIQDLLALRDETMKLKAEEGIKRLADDSELASIRRKVGGLPPQRSIYELGFAGKGRIYYSRGRNLRYRVLLIGAKNSQKTDLEYLSRLPAG